MTTSALSPNAKQKRADVVIGPYIHCLEVTPMDKQEILKKLNDSLEVSTIRLWIKVELVMVLLVCGLHYLTTRNAYWAVDPALFYGLVAALVLVPIFGVHTWELRRIYRKAEHYRFHQVKLTQPHGSFWARSMYFTLLIQEADGTIITRTHSIFGTGKYQCGPRMEDYLNKTVTIGYNEETEEVVVIG